MSPVLFSHWILPPKEKNNLYCNVCSQNIGQNIETLKSGGLF